jgi:hypothetical protein
LAVILQNTFAIIVLNSAKPAVQNVANTPTASIARNVQLLVRSVLKNAGKWQHEKCFAVVMFYTPQCRLFF